MADELKSMNFTFIVRSAPLSGPSSSEDFNDCLTEISVDLAALSSEWNNKLIPVIEGLPNGTLDTAVNVFQSGLDGKTLWVDGDVESTDDDLTFFNTTRNRPYTVKEALENIYTYVDTEVSNLSDTIIEAAGGLTDDEKERIGDNIFDATQTSTSTSLDGKSELNRLNVIQLAADMYGPSYSLDNDGSTNLTNSVFAMVDALLELHNGNWSNDITLSHTGISLSQTNVASSASVNDSYAGSPTTTEDDLNQVRTTIKVAKGTTAWTTSLPALYTGGADSLYDLLVSTAGTGTKTSTNPWGYNYSDIDGLNTRINAVNTFVGQGSQTDTSPSYSSNNYVTNGTSLETAISDLDAATQTVEDITTAQENAITAIQTFIGSDGDADTTPDYTSSLLVGANDPIETAISKLDYATATVSGLGVSHTSALSNLRTYVGADDASDTTPDYAYTNHISGGDSLETAIGDLDNILGSICPSANNIHCSEHITASGMMSCVQDMEITNSGYGVVLKSYNGTRWRLQVDDAGALFTTAL